MVQIVLYLGLSLTKILANTTQIEPYMLLIKTDQIFLNRQYGSSCVVSDWDLPKIIQVEKKQSIKTYKESLKK